MKSRRLTATVILFTSFYLAAAASECGASDQADDAPEQSYRRLSVKDYVDKMKAGWIGQMAGVGWGAPTEFRYRGRIIPSGEMPAWRPETINQFNQDDLYVEMTYLRSLERHGLGLTLREAGIDFANSGYKTWHASRAARDNLRAGVAPPDSGHPFLSRHADDIDFQIEADFSGLIAPGLPNAAIALGETFGSIVNYGDGLYAGQFVGGMYAEAFFEDDPVKIVEAGLRCVPPGSQYAAAIGDVLKWHSENGDDWAATWERVNDKYHLDRAHRRFSCSGAADPFNIDAKINGAYIAIGLLYGAGDLDRTIVLATRCGQDSDCNPSNAAGVIFATKGFDALPEKYTSALDSETLFSHTAYNFTSLVGACEKLARAIVVANGGRIEKDRAGDEVFVIPVETPTPSALVQCWNPGPIAQSRFTEEEMARIEQNFYDDRPGARSVNGDVEAFAPGWRAANCGAAMDPGLHPSLQGKKNILLTHPLDRDTGCVLFKRTTIPAEGKTTLHIEAGHHPRGDWILSVRADRRILFHEPVGRSTTTMGWRTVEIDLSDFAGESVLVEVGNLPSGWAWEAAYWAEISIETETSE